MKSSKIAHQYFAIYLLYSWVAITPKLRMISAYLSCVENTKCVKFQIPRYKCLNLNIFRIRPIQQFVFTNKIAIILVSNGTLIVLSIRKKYVNIYMYNIDKAQAFSNFALSKH